MTGQEKDCSLGGTENFEQFYERFRQWRMIRSGSQLQHSSGGVVTAHWRKADDSGWWMTDGSGLADRVFLRGDWTLIGWTKPDPSSPENVEEAK
jgi:hypothetical protein